MRPSSHRADRRLPQHVWGRWLLLAALLIAALLAYTSWVSRAG
jgi:hypothetical protein